MILTDREIQAALECGQIKITSRPGPEAYSSTSVDLTLSKFIRTWKDPVKGVDQVICPAAEGYNFNEVLKALSECKKVFIVSARMHRKGRLCPKCKQSRGIVSATGGRQSGGTAFVIWPTGNEVG